MFTPTMFTRRRLYGLVYNSSSQEGFDRDDKQLASVSICVSSTWTHASSDLDIDMVITMRTQQVQHSRCAARMATRNHTLAVATAPVDSSSSLAASSHNTAGSGKASGAGTAEQHRWYKRELAYRMPRLHSPKPKPGGFRRFL